MSGRVILTIHKVDADGLGSDTQTFLLKVGEELKPRYLAGTNISTIVIDRIEED